MFDLSDRISVMYHGRLVGTVNKDDVTTDDVLGMIILGKKPTEATREELEELESEPQLGVEAPRKLGARAGYSSRYAFRPSA